MSNSLSPMQNGAQLVSYFQSVFLNYANTEASREEALASEQRAMSELQYFGGSSILNPRNIPANSSAEIAKTSVDAHIKKVQADQIEQLSKAQLSEATSAASETYVGKKVSVTVYDKNAGVVESVWFNQNKGYSTSEVKTHNVKGRIKEVLLEKNALIIEPSLSARLLDPGRKFFVIYIINPYTFEPQVELAIT